MFVLVLCVVDMPNIVTGVRNLISPNWIENRQKKKRSGVFKYQSLSTPGGVDNSILGYCVWWCLTRGRGGEVGEGFRIRRIILSIVYSSIIVYRSGI